MMKRSLFVAAVVAAYSLVPSFAQQTYKYPFQNPSLSEDQRIDNILSLMTIDEKIDALGVQTGVPRLGIPSYGGSEGIHGVVQRAEEERHRTAITTTQFPQPPGMAATWDPEVVREAAAVEGHEARFISQTPKYDRSILMLWGPQTNLERDPRWGRGEEVYGEDPFLAGTMGVAFIKGLQQGPQGEDGKYWQAAALLKHFTGYGEEDGRNNAYTNFDDRLFHEYYAEPFRMGFVEGGARGVMASYNAWNNYPMDISPTLRSLLIDEWHLDVISTDGGAVKNMVTAFKRFPTQKDAVVACLRAGINQFLDRYKDETKAALQDGEITEAQIDALLRPKYRVTLRLGLLDPAEMVPYASVKDSPEPWNTDVDRAVSKKIALESVVLLKNEKDFLPLKKDAVKSIAVIGPLANSVHWDWYGGIPPYAVTPLDGIKAAVGAGVTVNYAADNTGDAAVKAARASDVAIVVVGNDPTCGDMVHGWNADGSTKPCASASDGREGRDRVSMELPEEALVKAVYAANPKTVMLLVSSFPFTINWSQATLPAILHMAHSSQDEGTALAAVLFGDYNPGGHLVETWPVSADQLPARTDYNIRDGYTYMYFKGKPLYPFGYGLSYTTFRYANLRTSADRLAKDGSLEVSVDVTNTGNRAGDAVVQLYVQHLKSKVARPGEELKGFARVNLGPNETKTVRIQLKASQLAYWSDARKGFVVEAEPVKLMVGDSSADIKLAKTVPVS